MAYYKGKDITFSINGTVIAACKSCDLSVSAELIETTSPTAGAWKDYIAGVKTWSLSASTILRTSIQDNVMVVGTKVTVRIGRLESSTGTLRNSVQGEAIISKFSVKASVKDLAHGEFKFQGTGALQ